MLETKPELGSSVLGGGDDYELLFTLPPERSQQVAALALELDLPLTCIGKMTEGEGVTVLAPDGAVVEVKEAGWNHLS